MPAFGTWGGDASAAAKEAVDGVRKDLDAHGQEALAVAQAAGRAADDAEQVKSDLAQLRAEAESLGMVVDPVNNTIEPGPGATGADPMEVMLKQMQPRLDAILADAVRADQELARAIAMATGDAPIPDLVPLGTASERLSSKPRQAPRRALASSTFPASLRTAAIGIPVTPR